MKWDKINNPEANDILKSPILLIYSRNAHDFKNTLQPSDNC